MTGYEASSGSRLYPVLGDPIGQVRTPTLINPVFARHGFDIVSFPLHVPAVRFESVWHLLRETENVAGIATTVPHKISAARLCDTLSNEAALVGAVNTARREGDGTMHGALFDGIGFVHGLGDAREMLRGAHVILVGAGGAGRAIAHALCGTGIARLEIVDVNRQAAEATAAIVDGVAGPGVAQVSATRPGKFDMLINASPIGLKPGDAFPLSLTELAAGMHVADIASFGAGTPLLVTARNAGCSVSDGNDMLYAQLGLVAGFIAGLPAGVSIDMILEKE
jgi:shikimate dehydrogenase|tara:strand:+ start:1229 stop:2068 length:840 start_codon:yes stop_codon:yes gene_type:complete